MARPSGLGGVALPSGPGPFTQLVVAQSDELKTYYQCDLLRDGTG